jgi:hypothetical protein
MSGRPHKKARRSVLEVLDNDLDQLDVMQSISDTPEQGSSDSDHQSGNEDEDEGSSQIETDEQMDDGENIVSIPSPPLTVTKKRKKNAEGKIKTIIKLRCQLC